MKKLLIICAVALILAVGGTAQALQTTILQQENLPSQDILVVPQQLHELGTLFPQNELILSAEVPWMQHIPCLENYQGTGAMVQVAIMNQTTVAWTDVWYVADYEFILQLPETDLTNMDGTVNGGWAFKIDSIGVNTPLVYEDNPNGIFEPGETWEFVIQDYANVLGMPPNLLGSPGVGDLSGFLIFDPIPLSTGSIIAIPAPGAILLGSLGVGLVGWLRRRRTL